MIISCGGIGTSQNMTFKLTSEMIKKVNSLRKLCGSRKLSEVKVVI